MTEIPILIQIRNVQPGEALRIQQGLQSLANHSRLEDLLAVCQLIREKPQKACSLIAKIKSPGIQKMLGI